LQENIINIKILQSDVKELSQKLLPKSIDAVVTEPYLGPVETRIMNNESRIKEIISELSELYLAAFEEFKKILKPDGKVVIILPIFSKNLRWKRKIFSQKIEHPLKPGEGGLQQIALSDFVLPSLKKQGWQIVNPIPEELRKNPVIKITERGSIIYSRPDQTVLREIFIFKLNLF